MNAHATFSPGRADANQQKLPPLRQDLEYLEQGSDANGSPAWVLYDPLQHRYFRIDQASRELLRHWQAGVSVSELAAAAREAAGVVVDDEQCAALVNFVRRQRLCEDAVSIAPDASRHDQRSWLMFIAERYLFFKVPLFRPNALLQASLPLVAPFYTRTMLVVVVLCGALGLYFVVQQWQKFVSTAADMASISGALWFLCAFVVVKSLHELGHAFTAARNGLHVAAMGVAFMVMAPILYTDVTDAWRLRSRRRRLAIHAAGVAVEISLACFALLAWAVLPDGTARIVAFSIATTGLVLTLAINLNPCMRFDGYFVLSELLGIDNLQTRAFAFGRWQLRQWLLAPDLPPPEILPARLQVSLIAYAWATWIYRLFLFTAIAVIVYTTFFKVLGLLLFALEIWLLIVRPIYREIAHWPKMVRAGQAGLRRFASLAVLCVLIALLFLPLSGKVEVPAIVEAGRLANVYPARAGQLAKIRVKPGQRVEKGAELFRLHDPTLENEIIIARNRLKLGRLRLQRVALDYSDREAALVLQNEAALLNDRLQGLERERSELVVRAPFAGVVSDVPTDLHVGQWIAKSFRLALVVGQHRVVARGYVLDSDLHRIELGASGKFVADLVTLPAATVVLKGISLAATEQLELEDLAKAHGGGVVARLDDNEHYIPLRPHYLAQFEVTEQRSTPHQVLRGVIQLDGAPESAMMRVYLLVARIVIRESGF